MIIWGSYRLQDFIPFTGDIYFRLLERMGETFWPLHLLTLALGGAALFLILKNRSRPAWVLIAPLWVFVAVAFFMQRYAELNWAGHYVGFAYLAQAVLLLLIALAGRGTDKARSRGSVAAVIGTAIALFGLVGQPLLAPLGDGSWYQAEVFGVHPDPTAVTSLGLVLIALRGVAMWLVALIPVLWLLLSGLTLLVLDAPGAIALFAVLVVGLTALSWKTLTQWRH